MAVQYEDYGGSTGAAQGLGNFFKSMVAMKQARQNLEQSEKNDEIDYKIKKLTLEKEGMDTDLVKDEYNLRKLGYKLKYKKFDSLEKQFQQQGRDQIAYTKGAFDTAQVVDKMTGGQNPYQPSNMQMLDVIGDNGLIDDDKYADMEYENILRRYDPNEATPAQVANVIRMDPSRAEQTRKYFKTAIEKHSSSSAMNFGLDSNQLTQGFNLAREVYGSSALRSKDARDTMVKPILERISAGETPDQIRDSLRFAGQSPEFMGPVRDAAQQIAMRFPRDQREGAFDALDDLATSGDTGRVRDYLKTMALESVGEERAKTIEGKERTVEFLGEIQEDLAAFEAKGGKTNIFNGTFEQINAKIGRVSSPELRAIATKILTARQQYRRSMTGVAFGKGESAEYDQLFPGIDKTANFNTANINALMETFNGDVDYFYSRRMGRDNYHKLFKEQMPVGNPQEAGEQGVQADGGPQSAEPSPDILQQAEQAGAVEFDTETREFYDANGNVVGQW